MVSEKEKAGDKVKTICRLITEETLTPARKEAQDTINQAKNESIEIIEQAKREAVLIHEKCDREIQHKLSVMQSSLDMSVKQSILFLKQQVTEHFFSKELHHMLTKEMENDAWVAKLLEALVAALQKEGIESEFQVVIPKTATRDRIIQSLTKEVADKLQKSGDHGIVVGNLVGVEVKLVKENFTLSVTEEALHQIIAKYVHRDLREKIFTT
jgi:V/A-type H+-transporting ATPase subunit E